ncbi:MAG TPA: hypothetical protein VFU49_07195, partial [Ktedonobacteraceae bacterium]|nr:hypothetical protein [Ktedonobacteraceae bacterium]
ENNYVTHRPEDKVRISSGDHKGQRGIVQSIVNGTIEVKLESGEVIVLPPEYVTNFSLAARKAWQTMRTS